MALQRPLRAIGLGAALLILDGSLPRADAACPNPGVLAFVYSPGNNEINVPTNVVISIHVFGDPIPSNISSQFSLWLAPSTQITTTSTRVDSNVSYITAIRLTPCPNCVFANQMYQIRQGATLLATFTTGSGPDLTGPPPAPVPITATVNNFDTHPDGGSDCFQQRVRQVRLNVPDVGKLVVYTIKEMGQTISADDSSTVGTFYCNGQPLWQGDTSWVPTPGQHTLDVTAVDRAGNPSPPVQVTFNASCTGGAADGGGGDGGQGGGPPLDGYGGGPVQPTGCSCGTGLSGAILLAGLGMILRRRRHLNASSARDLF